MKLYGCNDLWLWQANFQRAYYQANPRLEQRRLLMRKLRRKRDVAGWNRRAEFSRRLSTARFTTRWMIGYDGPSPTPQSAWPVIEERARLFGLW